MHLSRVLAGPSIVIYLCAHFAVAGLPQNSVRSRLLPRTELTGLGVEGILSDLATKYEVPIGIEETLSTPGKTAYRTTMDLPKGTLSSILDKIIASDERYIWQEVDGMIQVHPKRHREELLDVLIHDFSIEGKFNEESVKAVPAVRLELTT